ncbi:hypothetical protein A2V80_01335 [Candidatus Woesebacteria bacterium RBG_16_39_8b]|uniref:Uncharacterized protein n=1 Tax=Candidatus Woesebacteria bacterium RBG_16_39_8b TaxID=1802482 RepID=A0A1F7XHR3_9BACT|nr:MAG: hypothetical protein A2V80_01335 [Candidatus Woesebacteria bacterium RBG_16_39_8b]
MEGLYTGVASYDLAYWAGVGGVNSATTCWSEGVLDTTVNGARLPTVTLHQEGVQLLDQALGLGIGNTAQFFNSQAGVDISFNGTGHNVSATCGGK